MVNRFVLAILHITFSGRFFGNGGSYNGDVHNHNDKNDYLLDVSLVMIVVFSCHRSSHCDVHKNNIIVCI